MQFHKLTVRINRTEECLYSQLFTHSYLTFNLIKSIYLEQPTFLVDFQLTASNITDFESGKDNRYIYGYGLEEYEIATQEYELVLTLAPHDQDLVNNALRGTVYNETLLKFRQNQTRR